MRSRQCHRRDYIGDGKEGIVTYIDLILDETNNSRSRSRYHHADTCLS
jgi:hypothetical protein